jgi:hypothetical protein
MTEKLIYEENQNEPLEKISGKKNMAVMWKSFFTSPNGKYLPGNFTLFETNYMSILQNNVIIFSL